VPDTSQHRATPQLPPHVTMPLLELVTQQSLDQDYAHVARRRAQGDEPSPTGRGTRTAVLVALALFGLLVATAAVQETRSAPIDATNRAQLIDQIDQRRQSLARVQDRIGKQQARITVLQRESADLKEQEATANGRLARLQGRTGYGAVRGPGVRITLDDSPSGLQEEAVRDTDLADLVNALWAVGAEAIAINGERLTVLSAIRNVDVAIHVNGRPLSPPYVVEAIGDPRTLQSDLVNSPRGQHFFALADALGLQYSMTNQGAMVLPGASSPVLRALTSVGGDAVDNGSSRSSKGVQP
jgi:uncharacterized protein YlxW (UPF0749 family)